MVFKVFIAIPCYTEKVYSACMLSIIRLDRLLREHHIAVEIMMENRNPYLEHARNRLATLFMNSDADYLLFIDDDVEFDPHAVLDMIHTNMEVIGGLYSYKQMGVGYVVKPLDPQEQPIVPDVSKKEIKEVYGVATGCLLIHRRALTRMHEVYSSMYMDSRTGMKIYQFFDLTVARDNIMWGEDYQFCKKWKECGGKVYVALWVHCKHWGNHPFC